MSTAYKFNDPDGLYFITFATVEWIDVFTRPEYCNIILESLAYCQANKGLNLHTWCIMSNHLHLIISKSGNNDLSGIIRDFKKFTSVKILKEIETGFGLESRRNWMLWIFKSAGTKNKNNTLYQFWRQDNHPELLESNNFITQKLNYLHNNPVKAGFVDEPHEYRYSSARDYAGKKGLLKINTL